MLKGKFAAPDSVEELQRQEAEAFALMNRHIDLVAKAETSRERGRHEQYANIYAMLHKMLGQAIRGRRIIDEINRARQASSLSGESAATSVAA